MKYIKEIKMLREETGAGVLEVKQALEEFEGDVKKTREHLMKKAMKKADKKADRETKDGLVHSYIHGEGKVGSLVMVACETSFVAKTKPFEELCHEIALQVCSNDFDDISELLKSPYIKDESKTINDLITETIAKVGEKIEIRDFVKYDIRQ